MCNDLDTLKWYRVQSACFGLSAIHHFGKLGVSLSKSSLRTTGSSDCNVIYIQVLCDFSGFFSNDRILAAHLVVKALY